ncbi:MAG: hypothetical protein EHM56_08295, partial [Chloroflexi bacterium]
MSGSNGCKILATALIVAVIMGGLGFVSGFLTHTVLVADQRVAAEMPATLPPEATVPVTEPTVIAEAGESPGEASEATPEVQEEAQVPELTAEPTAEPEPAPTITIPETTGTSFDLFWEAWELIQRDYYGDLPSEEEMINGAIRGA